MAKRTATMADVSLVGLSVVEEFDIFFDRVLSRIEGDPVDGSMRAKTKAKAAKLALGLVEEQGRRLERSAARSRW